MEEYLTRLTGTLLGSYGVPPEKIAWKVRAPGIEMHLELAQFIGFLLTELVVNVIQHAFPDGMTGTMEVTIDRSRAGRYTVTVRDTGVGISEEMHITATAAPGLPTVRLLVEEYLKGHVAVEWSGGTTVTVTFGEEDMLVASPEATESEGQT